MLLHARPYPQRGHIEREHWATRAVAAILDLHPVNAFVVGLQDHLVDLLAGLGRKANRAVQTRQQHVKTFNSVRQIIQRPKNRIERFRKHIQLFAHVVAGNL